MPQRTVEQAFQSAVQHHRAGQLPQAEQLYRQIIAAQPNHAAALHHLGLIAGQVGRNDVAIELIGRAVALNPRNPEAHSDLGNALQASGQLDEAIAAFHTAIALKPNFPDAHYNLGNAVREKGRLDEAIDAYRQAIAANPAFPEAHSNLGRALHAKGQVDEAIMVCRRAIALKAGLSAAHTNLANALNDKGQVAEAIAAYRQAIALDPNSAEAYANLGGALQTSGQPDEAIAVCRQAIALNPGYASAHNNLGIALKDKQQMNQAIAEFRRAIALNPESFEAQANLGGALRSVGQVDEAIAAYREAIALKPDFANAHHNLGLALLLRGEFAQGWDEYEWRWKCKGFSSAPRSFPQPLWNGQPLEGLTLLLHEEQGFGDTLQFIRYLPLVKQRGGRIIIECQAELQRLLQPIAGDCQIITHGQPLPAFDLHCPLMSLPRVLGTTADNIPGSVPYLHADAEMAREWRSRLSADANTIKAGLAWAGNSAHKNDRNRSMVLSALAPLGRLPGVSFHSLQKGDPLDQARNAPSGLQLHDWAGDLTDFADTAALIANLDLVISVDTAVAHLAGAMGKPVWIMLPFAPDWRWFLDRQDTPWYPTMRLFRQSAIGDWDGVVRQVADELATGSYSPIAS